MNDKRTVSMIDLALQKHDTPAARCSWQYATDASKMLQRDTAIRYLAFFMTTEAF
jgi:hypothetical protein